MDRRRDTVVCRCEDVSDLDLDRHLRSRPVASLEDLKRHTRVMMGPCQGRICRTWLLLYWQRAQQRSLTTAAAPHPPNSVADLPLPGHTSAPGHRPPVRPTSVADIASLEIDEAPPWGSEEMP